MKHLSPELASVKKTNVWEQEATINKGGLQALLPAQHNPLLQGPGGGSTAALTKAFSGIVSDETAQSLAVSPTSAAAVPQPKPGVFPGVTDLSDTYGELAAGKRSGTQGVVLHRTESTTGLGTLQGYAQRIKSGSSIGAQYLIDETGQTSMVTPQDALTSHAKGFNSTTLGVEVVGPAKSFDRSGKHGSLREQVTAANLSPGFKQRLLGYDDKQLGNVAKWNGDQFYEDISGPQKRSVWNLSSNLATQYGLDMSSLSQSGKDESGANNYSLKTLPDFSGHEHISPKALGEGEPMVEFLRARQQYPQLVEAAQKKLAEMRTAGADPAQIEQYAAMVAKEQSTLSALSVDGTQTEIDAVKAERDAQKPAEALARENSRVDFYDNFYDRIGALQGAVK